MALQGTIDTFALADVLRLLASTGKTGRLHLDGDRGRGAVLVRDGRVLTVTAGADTRAVDEPEALFDLLRFADGEFVFDGSELGADDPGGDGWDVEELVQRAEELLGEWREIERVLPSCATWVTLRAEAPGDNVKIAADQWRLVANVGTGSTAGELGERLDASQLTVGRLVRALDEAGLVELGEAPLEVRAPSNGSGPAHLAEVGTVDDVTEEWSEADVRDEAVDEVPQDPSVVDASLLFEEVEPVTGFGTVPEVGDVGWPELSEVDEAPPLTDEAVEEAVSSFEDDFDAAGFARRLAELSPRAARAVAAAAKATDERTREAALAELEETDDVIDRDQLMRFLGSIDA